MATVCTSAKNPATWCLRSVRVPVLEILQPGVYGLYVYQCSKSCNLVATGCTIARNLVTWCLRCVRVPVLEIDPKVQEFDLDLDCVELIDNFH